MHHKECDSCHCEFLYQTCEIKDEYERIDAYNSQLLYRYIKCPECGHIIRV